MSSGKLNLPLQLLLFLRFAQLACTTLTTYACCFYIGFYVYYRGQPAPHAEYFLLFTVCPSSPPLAPNPPKTQTNKTKKSLLTALELLLTSSYTIRAFCKSETETPRIKYGMFLITSGIMTLLNYNAYSWLRTVPYLIEYNEGNNSGIYYYPDSVEHGTCAINDMVIVAGGLNVYVLLSCPVFPCPISYLSGAIFVFSLLCLTPSSSIHSYISFPKQA
jgi:hypothetical protein